MNSGSRLQPQNQGSSSRKKIPGLSTQQVFCLSPKTRSKIAYNQFSKTKTKPSTKNSLSYCKNQNSNPIPCTYLPELLPRRGPLRFLWYPIPHGGYNNRKSLDWGREWVYSLGGGGRNGKKKLMWSDLVNRLTWERGSSCTSAKHQEKKDPWKNQKAPVIRPRQFLSYIRT